MNLKKRISLFGAAAGSLLLVSCSNTRFLPSGEILYTGKSEKYISATGGIDERQVRRTTASVTQFNPNNSIGGKRVLLPIGLWFYNYWKPDSLKTPGWLYRTLSKEPVLISNVNPEVRCRKLESELFNMGYFHSTVSSEIKRSSRNPRKASVIYYVDAGRPFRYDSIAFSQPADGIDSIISSFSDEISIRKGDIFNLETLKSESRKVSDRMQEEGYFYFNQSGLRYTADTLDEPYSIDLRIGKSSDFAQNLSKKFVIDGIRVIIKGDVDSALLRSISDSVYYEGIGVVTRGVRFKPDIIARAVYFRTGDVYSVSAHRQTLSHLSSYGIFKFINLRYIPDRDTTRNQLDLLIELTTSKDISLDLEANVVTKSTGFSGPGFAATLAQGNLGGDATRLLLKLNGGLEWQWANKSTYSLGTLSYNVGVSASIIFPKLLVPSFMITSRRFNLPQTSVTIGFELLNKIQYYKMSSVNMGFGYMWKKPDKITHGFYPVFLNSIALLKTTHEFDSIMDANPYIRKSFEEQFIVGMKYDFTYDNNLISRPHGFYFQGGVSSSGNLIEILHGNSGTESGRPYTVAGNAYSQFLKFTSDIRYFRNMHNKSLAFRFYAGAGIPYINSEVMPYVEQFYSGGSNSIRAFIARSVGPGSLPRPENTDIIDQTGDIRLEGNAEFRFRLSKIVHGALFVDAGNVWLMNPDSTRSGAEFRPDTFLSQLAVGTGIGLRFDFGFFVLRTDLGFPLRTNYETGGTNWLIQSGKVFREKVFNLAIGYPF